MTEFKNYSFKNAAVIFGVEELVGYGEGDDVVNIDPEAEQFTDLAGAKGDVTRTQSSDNRCTVTVKLLQTSSSNKVLMAIHNSDRETGVGVLPMVLQDKELGETYVINNAWISKLPTITRGQAPNTMDWTFRGDFWTGVIE